MIMGSNFVNLFYLLKSGRNGPIYATVADAQNDGAITIKYGRGLDAVACSRCHLDTDVGHYLQLWTISAAFGKLPHCRFRPLRHREDPTGGP